MMMARSKVKIWLKGGRQRACHRKKNIRDCLLFFLIVLNNIKFIENLSTSPLFRPWANILLPLLFLLSSSSCRRRLRAGSLFRRWKFIDKRRTYFFVFDAAVDSFSFYISHGIWIRLVSLLHSSTPVLSAPHRRCCCCCCYFNQWSHLSEWIHREMMCVCTPGLDSSKAKPLHLLITAFVGEAKRRLRETKSAG